MNLWGLRCGVGIGIGVENPVVSDEPDSDADPDGSFHIIIYVPRL